jgi:hypothetical protein
LNASPVQFCQHVDTRHLASAMSVFAALSLDGFLVLAEDSVAFMALSPHETATS